VVHARAALRLLLLALFACASLGASCGQRAVTLMPGVVNDTGNRSLRRAIFSYAIDQLCTEMKKRSLPLRMSDPEPSIGRFFPTGCSVTELPNENLYVQVVGHGYAWTNLTGRVGFEAAAQVEYDHDFLVEGSSMYGYFRAVRTQSSTFTPLMFERSDGGVAGPALSLLGTATSQALAPLGQRILAGQLARGFTVVREGDATVAFSLGVLEKGHRPVAPFDTSRSRALVLVNDRAELHAGQRDFVGPFEITEKGRALGVTALVEGAPAADVLIVPQTVGDAWIAQYERYPQTGPAAAPPLVEDSIFAAREGSPGAPATSDGVWRRAFPVPPGSYYVVFDHTATAGRTSPVGTPGDPRAATVSYAVELLRAD